MAVRGFIEAWLAGMLLWTAQQMLATAGCA
jgi:hypothetical protein